MFFIILRDIKFKVYEVLSKSPDKKAKQLNRLALAVACELERVTGGWLYRDNFLTVEVAALYLTLYSVDCTVNVLVRTGTDGRRGLIKVLFRYLTRGSRKTWKTSVTLGGVRAEFRNHLLNKNNDKGKDHL